SHWRKIRVQLAPQCLLLLFSFVEHSSCLCVYISIAVVLSPFSPASVSISLAVVPSLPPLCALSSSISLLSLFFHSTLYPPFYLSPSPVLSSVSPSSLR